MARRTTKTGTTRIGKPAQTATPPENEGGSTSYSTRFDPRHRELIEEAAKLLNVTPAKLIRESAVARAAHVVNAAGNARYHLRQIAVAVADQILNPSVEYDEVKYGELSDNPSSQCVRLDYYDSGRMADRIAEEEAARQAPFEGLTVTSIRPVRPHGAVLDQIKSALETSGTEFLKLLLDEWNARQSSSTKYEPRVKPESLIGGDEGDGE